MVPVLLVLPKAVVVGCGFRFRCDDNDNDNDGVVVVVVVSRIVLVAVAALLDAACNAYGTIGLFVPPDCVRIRVRDGEDGDTSNDSTTGNICNKRWKQVPVV